MFELLVGFAAGLVVGWNVLPQPVWVRNLYDRWFGGNAS
jgi:hypothetical protein